MPRAKIHHPRRGGRACPSALLPHLMRILTFDGWPSQLGMKAYAYFFEGETGIVLPLRFQVSGSTVQHRVFWKSRRSAKPCSRDDTWRLKVEDLHIPNTMVQNSLHRHRGRVRPHRARRPPDLHDLPPSRQRQHHHLVHCTLPPSHQSHHLHSVVHHKYPISSVIDCNRTHHNIHQIPENVRNAEVR